MRSTREHYEMWVKAKKKIMGDGSDDGVDLLMLKRVVNACIKERQHNADCHGQERIYR